MCNGFVSLKLFNVNMERGRGGKKTKKTIVSSLLERRPLKSNVNITAHPDYGHYPKMAKNYKNNNKLTRDSLTQVSQSASESVSKSVSESP